MTAPAVEAPPVPTLTSVELDVLLRIARGDSNPEMCAALWLSLGGMQYRCLSLFRKLDARNRAHAVTRAVQLGLITVVPDVAAVEP